MALFISISQRHSLQRLSNSSLSEVMNWSLPTHTQKMKGKVKVVQVQLGSCCVIKMGEKKKTKMDTNIL